MTTQSFNYNQLWQSITALFIVFHNIPYFFNLHVNAAESRSSLQWLSTSIENNCTTLQQQSASSAHCNNSTAWLCVLTITDESGIETTEVQPDILCNNISKPSITSIPANSTFQWIHTSDWGKCITSNCIKDGKISNQKCLNLCSSKFIVPDIEIGKKGCIIESCVRGDNHSIVVPNEECHATSTVTPLNLCQLCRISHPIICPPVRFITNWSPCSKSCGKGTRTRTSVCTSFTTPGESAVYPADSFSYNECNTTGMLLPIFVKQSCNLIECPPEYQIEAWSKCEKARPETCGTGFKKRSIKCIKIHGSGQVESFPGLKPCIQLYGKENIPRTWDTCFDYGVIWHEQCKGKYKGMKPEMKVANNIVIQMRPMRRLRSTIGEQVSAFVNTRLLIKCTVNYFDPRRVVWYHNNVRIDEKSKRVFKDYKGRLLIRNIQRSDIGYWTCRADSVNASTLLNVIFPNDGYKHFIWREKGVAEQDELALMDEQQKPTKPNIVGRSRKHVTSVSHTHWIAREWGACSATCGEAGVMHRNVLCEKINSNYFRIVDDAECNNLSLIKPTAVAACQGLPQCPQWIRDPSGGKCTKQCIKPGEAIRTASYFCAVNNTRYPDKYCEGYSKPSFQANSTTNIRMKSEILLHEEPEPCIEPECELTWKVTSWSSCSKTCGGAGLMSRQIVCIWKKTEEVAEQLCYKHNVAAPQVLKECISPPCKLVCIDQSESCRSYNHFSCSFTIVQKHCCKTCYSFFQTRLGHQKNFNMKNLKFT